MLFADEDDYGMIHEGDPEEEPLLYGFESNLIRQIARSGFAVDPSDIESDMGRGFTDDEESAYLRDLVQMLYESRLFKRRYFEFAMPKFDYQTERWIVIADLTDRGWDAYESIKKGVFWNVSHGCADFDRSYDYYEQMMMESSFRRSEEVFSLVQALPHRIYDRLRARIPYVRERVWTSVLTDSSEPLDGAWATLRWTTLDGLDDLKKNRVRLHVRAYERALRRAANTDHYLLQPGTIASIPREPEYDSVRKAAQARSIELWIGRVQKITHPEDKLFKQVESLGTEFELVKAEAFLQKMKCWTPLDQFGQRT